MQTGLVTLENSLALSQMVKQSRVSNKSTPRCTLKRHEDTVHTNICMWVSTTPLFVTTPMSINWRTSEQNGVYPYNESLLSCKKWSTDPCCSGDALENIMLKRSHVVGCQLYEIPHQVSPQRQGEDDALQAGWAAAAQLWSSTDHHWLAYFKRVNCTVSNFSEVLF